MEIARWTWEEARSAVESPDLQRSLGPAVGVAAVVVELGDHTGRALGEALSSLPVVTIGVGPNAGPTWDLRTSDPDSAVAGIVAAPLAAVTVAQLLRGWADRSPKEGLLIESLAYATLQGGPEFAAWLQSRGRRVRTDDAARVRVDDRGDTVDVVLTRPRLRNLLDARMRDELVDIFRALSHGPARRIRLRGEGPAFCAGGDPAEFGTVSDPATAHLLRATANIAPWLLRLASLTTAEVHGACVGAGIEIAAFCDRVVADPSARFRLPETRMGLLPGAGGTVSIPARIGRHRTLGWLLSDAEIGPETALSWGLIDEIRTIDR